jgi:uncharacterized protein YoxC
MKYIPVIISVIAVAVMLWIFIDAKNKLHRDIIEAERKTRDSISQKIIIFASKSDSLQAEINRMKNDLTTKINSFRYDLYKIRIIHIPAANYNNDTVLLSRLLSG